MNKRWTEQKYVIHFLLSVMVLIVCGVVCYGASYCQDGELRHKGAELAWAAGETDERYIAYTASEQRVIEVDLLASGGKSDAAQMQDDRNTESEQADMQGGHAAVSVANAGIGADGQAAADADDAAEAYAAANAGIGVGGQAAADADDAAEVYVVADAGIGAGGQAAAGADDAAEAYVVADAGIGAGGQAAANADDAAGQTAAYADGNADGHAVAGAAVDVDGNIAAAGQTGGGLGTALQADAGTDAGADGAVNTDIGADSGRVIAVSDEDYEALLRIVQAEAGNEDTKGKILVANVVLNRVADARFPNSVYEVVFQRAGGKAQFSPVASGSYYKVVVSDDTIEAVERALSGEDYSEGALYFAARRYAGSSQMRWFDECLTKLFSYGGHEFFTS